MSKFSKWLEDQLASITVTASEAPRKKLDEGETIVATISHIRTQKLFILAGRMKTKRNMLQAEMGRIDAEAFRLGTAPRCEEPQHNRTTCNRCRLRQEVRLIESRATKIEQRFWTTVRTELAQSSPDRHSAHDVIIDIREGWHVVAYPQE